MNLTVLKGVCHYAIPSPKSILALLGLILFSQIMYAQVWMVQGNEGQVAATTTSFTSIATKTESGVSVPYVVLFESGAVKVKKRSGEIWQEVGNPVFAGTASYCRLYVSPANQLIVTYVDIAAGNRLAVRQFNEASQNWEPLGNIENNLYVSSASVTYSIGQFSSTPRSSAAFDNDGNLCVAFSDEAGFTPFVKKYSGGSWQTIGGAPVSADRAVGVNIAWDSLANQPWLVYIQQATPSSTTGPLKVYRFAEGSWVNMPLPVPLNGGSSATGATGSVRHSAIAFTKDWNPIVTYFNTGSNNRATAAMYTKSNTTWSLSGVLSARDAPGISAVRDTKGNVFVSFTDAVTNGSGRTLVRVFMLAAGTSVWGELKNESSASGIDEPAGNLTLAPGTGNYNPFIVYTKANSGGIVTPIVQAFFTDGPNGNDDPVTTPMQMEKLNRGLVAIRTSSSEVYIGWRLLGTESKDLAFNVYADNVKVNINPITSSTNFLHNTAQNSTYHVRPVVGGEEFDPSETTTVLSNAYLQINLQKPADGTTLNGDAYSYVPNDCSVGDVDGDGVYEIIVKWDPTNAKDNAQSGYTGNVYLDCYKLDGTRLWRIDLGRNIRAGAHYTQFMVYDFDGDGKAEVACKTADATVDGMGVTIGNAAADFRNINGYILTGPEFLTMFNGITGAAMQTVDYLPARGSVNAWGDDYGNRVDRFIAAVAYLDGQRPSLIMGRGYYTRLVRVAWDWRDGKFTRRWSFDSNSAGNGSHAGQGNHQMSVGDMDGDGKQEFVNGSSAQNNNGNGLWANSLGHGDALHLTDIDPDRPGLEIWQPFETPASNGQIGAGLIDAKTGIPIFTVPVASDDVGRALAADIDPRHKGLEVWASRGNLYNAKGTQIGTVKPSMNFAIWWDADTTRELLDGNNITKWNWNNNTNPVIFTATNCSSNNGTKATPALSADLFGDWREEVIFRTNDNNSLRIFTTTILAENKFFTLMHDPHYRVAIAWQNSAYNQPPHPGFYLGTGMEPQPVPNIYIAPGGILPLTWVSFEAKKEGAVNKLIWKTAQEENTHHFVAERSLEGTKYVAIGKVAANGSQQINTYTMVDHDVPTETAFYRLRQVDKDGKYSYSAVQKISREKAKNSFTVFPNPLGAGKDLQVQYSGNPNKQLSAKIVTADGRIVAAISGNLQVVNDGLKAAMGKAGSGLYFVQLQDGTEQQTFSVIRQ